tara:strand:- start:315 stop:1169 length:855 start_codon:yes stop_codon:yes gene_type:complete
MKLFKNFVLLLATIFVFELTFSKDANADDACPKTGDVYDVVTDFCEAQPDEYEIVIFNLYLCTSSPTIPTTSSAVDLTSGGCTEIFNNSLGATASVTQGSELNLTGTYTRPPNNTYTHGYAILDNTFGITASIEFAGNMTGQTGGTGTYCSTVAGSGTSNSTGDPSNSSVCSTSPVTAGKFVETLESFGGSGSFESTAEVTNINGTTAAITGILVDTSGQLATTDADVDKLEGLVTFADPVTFTDAITEVTMSFNVGSGMSLYISGGTSLGMGSGPFQAIITTN